jgi:succinate---hydroxymethylglutarate CoA-transferase
MLKSRSFISSSVRLLSTTQSNGPLAGIRVIDFSRVLAGPYCASLLGDMGAEVIKIEAPEKGDDTRQWGPPYSHGESAYFISCNRNKLSMTVNMKVEQSMKVIRRLVENSDVLIENFLTGKAESLGIGFEDCTKLNPRLVYCSISGFGATGIYASKPGYDGIISAMYGMQHITGHANGPPVKPGVALTDVLTGLIAYGGISAALFERAGSGLGQKVETSLMEAQLSALVNVASSYLTTGQDTSKRWGTAHPSIVPYQTFPCAQDGGIFIAIGNDGQFRSLCETLLASGVMSENDVREVFSDEYDKKGTRLLLEKYRTNSNRVKNREELLPLLESIFMRHTTAFWDVILNTGTFPFGPVRSIKEAFDCPQAQARDMVQYVNHSKIGKLAVVGSPVKFSRTPCSVRLPPPLLGEHTYKVMHEVLHFSDSEIEELVACGAVTDASNMCPADN